MTNYKFVTLILLIILSNIKIFGQNQENYDRKLFFPDLDNYRTLLTDFHQHTVF